MTTDESEHPTSPEAITWQDITTALQPNDVVQIDPDHSLAFAACLAIVDEVHDWGVVATVLIPGNPPGRAPIRIKTGDFARIGEAAFVPGVAVES